MKHIILSLAVSILFYSASFSQYYGEEEYNGGEFTEELKPVEIEYFNSDYDQQGLIVTQSSDLQKFLETVAAINEKRGGFEGYRVKVFAENNRNARSNANNLRVRINSQQDTVQAYVVYSEPNFEVHLGDFRTRFEAVRLLKNIEEDYPQAYIVKTIVNFPELSAKTED